MKPRYSLLITAFLCISFLSAQAQCHLYDMVLTPSDCNVDGFYSVTLNFQHQENGDQGFTVTGNGNNYGTFAYADLPITLSLFQGNGQAHEFVIHDVAHPDCQLVGFLDGINCNAGACHLYDLVATSSDCNSAGQFFVTLNFQHQNTGDQFTITGNGNNYGTFAYANLPVTLGPFSGSGQVLEFGIHDVATDGCDLSGTLTAPTCSTTGDCHIYDIVATPGDCNPDGTYSLTINFNYANVTNNGFDVSSQGQFIGYFLYADLPVTIASFPASGNAFDVVTVSDNDNTPCHANREFAAPNCSGACSISGLTAVAGDCNNDGYFYVTLNFEHQNTGSAGFTVAGNGTNYGTFSYDDLPLTLGPLAGNGQTTYEFSVHDVNHPDCHAVGFVGPINCGGTGACHLYELAMTSSDCNSAGNFFVTLNFQHQNTGDQFTITGNGNNYGTFAYANLPVTLGPFSGSGQVLEFGIHDVATDGCDLSGTLLAPTCSTTGDCHIYDIVATPGDCNPDGTYSLTINFNYANVTNNGFDVSSQGQFIGYFLYADLPVTIASFPASGNAFDVVTVSDNDNTPCHANREFAAPNCSGACSISGLTAVAGDCNNDGYFYVTLNFEHQNTGSAGFTVAGNGTNYGTFSYDDLPLTLGPLAGNGQTTYEFSVHDVNHPDCHAVGFVGPINCGGTGACHLYELAMTSSDCNSAGNFFVTLNFQHQNTGDQFTITGNGNNYGTFAYANLPVTLGPFSGSGQVLEFGIHDVATDGCDLSGTLLAPTCSTTGDCHIYDIVATPGDCNPDGTYSLTINFNYANVTNNGFDVSSQGQFIGYFLYADLPVTIASFPASGNAYDVVTVSDNDNTPCHANREFAAPNCSGACSISGLTAVAGDCNNDGYFYVTLNFEHQNTGSAGFTVAGNGTNYGTFSYDDLPLTLGPLAGNGQTTYEFSVHDVNHPDCHAVGFVGPINCGGTGDCHLYDLATSTSDCNSAGQFYVVLNFQHQNTSDHFTITGNGNNYGTFGYGNLPVTLGPFPGTGQTLEFVIHDALIDGCTLSSTLTAPNCNTGGDCQLSELTLQASDCDTSGHFYVTLNFQHQNTGGQGFTVHGNGNNYGTFSYDDLPITLGPLGANGGVFEFSVRDVVYEGCHIGGTVTAPECLGGGQILMYNLVVFNNPCNDNGQFSVTMNFYHQNTGPSFKVNGNGHYYGTYSYSTLPLTIGGINGDGITPYEFVVQDIQYAEGHLDNQLGVVECEITGIDPVNEQTIRILPTNEVVTIQLSNTPKEAKARLFSYNGQLLREQKLSNLSTDMDIRSLPAGLYACEVISDGKRVVKTLIRY